MLCGTCLTLARDEADMFAGIWSPVHPAVDVLGVGPGDLLGVILFRSLRSRELGWASGKSGNVSLIQVSSPVPGLHL